MPVRPAALPLACSILAACLLTRPACSQTQPPGFDDAHAWMADGTALPLHHWLPSGKPQAVIVAVHGMNDHGASFERRASTWPRLVLPYTRSINGVSERLNSAEPGPAEP